MFSTATKCLEKTGALRRCGLLGMASTSSRTASGSLPKKLGELRVELHQNDFAQGFLGQIAGKTCGL